MFTIFHGKIFIHLVLLRLFSTIFLNIVSLVANINVINILELLKTFFLEFVAMDDNMPDKYFKYREQLTKIAHREQISFEIDLDDVQIFDDDLAMSITNNTRRYVNLVLDVCTKVNYCMKSEVRHK